MFCQHCGGEVKDEAMVCIHCGCALKNQVNTNPITNTDTPKTGMGVLLAFVGLIGLIIGLVIYPTGTVARHTFLKGFWITIGVFFGVGFLIGLLSVI